jgi:hypothetical protein
MKYKHTVRIAVVLALVAAAATVVSAQSPARAVQGLESGYWWQGQPDGAPFPPPPNVPANGLWVSGTEASPVAIAALRFQLGAAEATPALTAKVNSAFPPAQLAAAINAGQIVVMACPATPGWKPAQAGAWSARVKYNCAGAVHGTPNADGTAISFDLAGVVSEGTVDVALVPGTGGAALPSNPIPGAPATPQPSGFDVTLQPVTADQVHTGPGAASTSDLAASPAPADAAAPSSDIASSPTDFGSFGSPPATDFNFAANAVQPSAGVGASSTPSVAPGSLAPQTRGISESSIKENKGYRALAVILLAALLWWAWRQAVPPRRHRRTIYDGPPASTPTPDAAS